MHRSSARTDNAADRAHTSPETAVSAVDSSGVLSNGAKAPPTTFRALQEWEGYVVDVDAGKLTARLIDLTAGDSHEREEASIPMAAISEDDVGLAVPGGMFRWLIGYERSSDGSRCVSRIVFRRLGPLTQADIDSGTAWARGIERSFTSRDAQNVRCPTN